MILEWQITVKIKTDNIIEYMKYDDILEIHDILHEAITIVLFTTAFSPLIVRS